MVAALAAAAFLLGTGAVSTAAAACLGCPGTPSQVSALPLNGAATVSFVAPAPTGTGAITYSVAAVNLVNPTLGVPTVVGSSSPITVTGLTNGSPYSFTVTAVNGSGSSEPSPPSSPVVPLGSPPGTVFVSNSDHPTDASVWEVFQGSAPRRGDGLSNPQGVAIDQVGNLFIADTGHNRVVKITPTGTQTTVPVIGLDGPTAVTVDGAGNLFVVDTRNHRVVTVDPRGAQSTVPATGLYRPTGVAVDATGNVYIVGPDHGDLVKVHNDAARSQTYLTRTLNEPTSVAVDTDGGVFVSHRFGVSRLHACGQPSWCSVHVPGGVSQSPAMAVGADGDLFMAPKPLSQPAAGHFGVGQTYVPIVVAPAGGGPTYAVGTPARCEWEYPQAFGDLIWECNSGLINPRGVAVYAPAPTFVRAAPPPSAIVGVASRSNAYDAYTRPYQPAARFGVASGGLPPGMSLNSDTGVLSGTPSSSGTYSFVVAAKNAATAALAPPASMTVYPIGAPTGVRAVAGNASASVSFTAPAVTGPALSPHATYTVTAVNQTNPGSDRRTATGNTSPITVTGLTNGNDYTFTVVATTTAGLGAPSTPSGKVRPAAAPDNVLVADTGSHRVLELDPVTGRTVSVGSGLTFPGAATYDRHGNVFIADTYNDRVLKLPVGGQQTVVAAGLAKPTGLAVDRAGNVLIADTNNGRVIKVAPGGEQTVVAAGLRGPEGLAVDSAGDVFIADTSANTVLKAVPAGQVYDVSIVPTDGLDGPHGLAVNSAGDLFIADGWNKRVVKLDAHGSQTTVRSDLKYARGVAVTTSGGLLIADGGANRVIGTKETQVWKNPQSVAVYAPPPTFTAASPPTTATGGSPYGTHFAGYTYTASTPAGAPAATFAVASGALPPGLSLNPTSGLLSGTPTTAGKFTFVVQAQNAATATRGPRTTISVTGEPGAPTGVSASPRYTSAVVSFAAPASSGAGAISSYTVTAVNRTRPASERQTARGFASPIRVSGLANGDRYTFTVTATNSFGTGAPSTASDAVTPVLDAGTLSIADTHNNRVVLVPPVGGAGQTSMEGGMLMPSGSAIADSGDLFVAGPAVTAFRASGGPPIPIGVPGRYATAVAVDGRGIVYVAKSDVVLKYLPDGLGGYSETTLPTSGYFDAVGLAVDGLGNVFIADSGGRVLVAVPNGIGGYTQKVVPVVDITGASATPAGVAVDSAGNIFVTDSYRGLVYVMVSNGRGGYSQRTVPTTGLSSPSGIAMNSAGHLYIADTGNNRVVELTPNGAGGYTQTAVAMSLSRPAGVAVYAPPPRFLSQQATTSAVAGTPYTFRYVAEALRGQPAPTFAVASGELPPGLTLNASSGVLSGTPTALGAYRFVVRTQNAANATFSVTNVVTVKPGPATSVSVAMSRASIVANGTSTSVATATVTDANGYPVSGDRVRFKSSAGQLVAASPSTAPGTYQATITSTTTARVATITATDSSVIPSVAGSTTLTQTAGPATAVAVALSPASITANGTSTSVATATVTDANGNRVSGDRVAFASSGEQRVGPVSAGAAPGTYQATITSSTVAGTATITATDSSVSPGVAGSRTLTQTAGPASKVAVALSRASITADGESTTVATATVTDANGNPSSRQRVLFYSNGYPTGVVTAGAAPGTYQATITATKVARTRTITATDVSVTPSVAGSATLTQTAGPATGVAVALSPASITANGRSTSVATATVVDANDNRVSGDDVAFRSSGDQQIGEVTAGAAPGTYRATVTSSVVAGTATITATDRSVDPSVSGSKTLTQTAGPASKVAVGLSRAAIVADGESTTVATATVTDANGNPVSRQRVLFSSNGYPIGAVTAGAAPGTYEATITATKVARTRTITAKDVSVDPSVAGSATLTQTAGPATGVAVALSPASITANGRSTSVATATVVDANGNRVSGDDVAFRSSGDQRIDEVTPGAAPGTYQATITSSVVAGTATITATDRSVDPGVSGMKTLTQTAGPARNVAVGLSRASIVADGVSTTVATATVTDANGNPVPRQRVLFSSNGYPTGAVVTAGEEPGTYEATITSTTTARTRTITATDSSVVPSVAGSAILTQTAGPATRLTMALSPASITANGRSTSAATATATDANGNRVSGDDVAFRSSGDQQIGEVAAGASPGTYRATITSSTSVGTARITAIDSSVTPSLTRSATLTQTSPAAPTVTLGLSPESITADGTSTSTATATVTDADGYAVSGHAIAITSSGDQPIGPVTAGATPGTYQATITSSTTAGTATITATDSSVTPSVAGASTLTQTAGPAKSVEVALSPARVTADGESTSTATATVTDANGNPVSGDAVAITSTGDQTIGEVTAGESPGTYQATITSTTTPGTATITATDSSVTPSVAGSTTLTQTAGPATDVTVALSPASIAADGVSTSVATATVTDADGDPVSGDAILITSGGDQRIGEVTAGAAPGTYQATITSSTTAGTATITATDSSVTPNVAGASTLTQTAGPAKSVEVALSPETITADGASTSTATATVTDANGNPVSGDAVAITSTGGQQIGSVTAGATAGTYEATITSTITAGTSTITATDTSVTPEVAGAATLTQVSDQATDVSLRLAPASITANGTSTSTATATVTDANGNPVSGDIVAITSTGDQRIGAVTVGAAPGTYEATITSTTAAGTATITATDSSVAPDLVAAETLTQTSGPAKHVVLVLSPESILANGSSTSVATATVTDAHRNPVSADTVEITSAGGQHIGPVTAGATPGTYQATVTSGTSVGMTTITATDTSITPNVAGTATLTQTNDHAKDVVLRLTPASITANGTSTSTATATVTDANGNPVSGETVAITGDGDQRIGAVTAGAAPGTYEATITSSTTAGTARITATDSSVDPSIADAATLTQTAGPATRVTLALSPASILANGTSTATATATVTDASGNPVSDDAVAITSSGGQQVGPVTAGAAPGSYQATITSTTTVGTATITATDGSVTPSIAGAETLTQTKPRFIYWSVVHQFTGAGSIARAKPDGTGVKQDFIAVDLAQGLAVDDSYVYWTPNHFYSIGRADVNGTGSNMSFIPGAYYSSAVAVDGSHIYWNDNSQGGIGRANLDGTGASRFFIEGANAHDVAVDGAYVYWINGGSISRARRDGTGVKEYVPSNGGHAVAIGGSYVYWTDGRSIGRTKLDGTEVTPNLISGFSGPAYGVHDLAVDDSYVYWTGVYNTDKPSGAVGRAKLDGTGVEQNYIPVATPYSPRGLAVTP